MDNWGIIYVPATPWLNNSIINLCTGNPTTGSPNPNTLVEEFPNGIGGVISGWAVSSSSQRWAQQSTFFFNYSATGPFTSSGSTAWATVISGVLTVIATSTTNVYTIIGMTATRQTTNFANTVSTSLTLVGAMMAGNNNNMLYINSSTWPQGMDSQGWGYMSSAAALFPSAAGTSSILPANTSIQLVNGVLESSAGQSVLYTNPTVSFVAYSVGSSAPPSAALPSGPIVLSSSSSSSSSGSSLSKGAIAGIVIGCSIGFGLLCAIAALLLTLQYVQRDEQDGGRMRKQQPVSELSKIEAPTEDSRTGELEMH